LLKNSDMPRFVTWHDFSRADKENQINRALLAAEKPNLVKGTGFSPYISRLEQMGFSP